MQQLRDYTVSMRDNDVNTASARKAMSSANELAVNSPLQHQDVTATSREAASSSMWSTLDVADQQVRQVGLQLGAGQGRQSLASVGNESSFFKKDAVSDEHLCSTPSRSDDIDDQVLLRQQSMSPPSDWMCTPVTLDFSPVSPPTVRYDQGQGSPPVASALYGRRYACLQMPQLTPIMEADNELGGNDDDEDDDDGKLFIPPNDAVAAKYVEVEFNVDDRQTEENAVKLTPHHHHAQHHITSSDVLDLTIVTPMTSQELTPLSVYASSSNSDVTVSRDELGDQVPERDVGDQSGAEIIARSRFDVDDLSREVTGQQQNKHESSYSAVYNSYMYTDEYTNSPSADTHQCEWNAVDHSTRAQSAVSALGQRGRGLAYQKSFLNRTPVDIDMMQLSTDGVYRRRRLGSRDQQLQQQTSVMGSRLGRHGGAVADVQTLGDDETLIPVDRRIRRRLAMYHENLI